MALTSCRICGAAHITPVVDLGFHPLADTFLPPEVQLGAEVAYPLQLGLCGECGHVFTLYPVSPEDRYQKHDYSYDSSNSQVSIAHFCEFAQAVIAEQRPAANALVVDFGSNVGTLLSHFKDAGFSNVLGIEPSGNISRLANDSGVRTFTQFFDNTAARLIHEIGKVDVLLSSNVVNHADDMRGLFRTARAVLSPGGAFVFEVPYLLDLVQGTAFDTIYHEHVHYCGIKPIAQCLAGAGFEIFKVERLDYMCGSIRVYARVGSQHSAAALEAIAEEERFGLYALSTYAAFMDRVRQVKFSVNCHLWKIRAAGGKIIGIGAATKGNTFLNYCRLDNDLIAYVTDASPLKIGKMTPGSHIPIIADNDIDAAATHAVILPWNIAPFLQKKLAHLGLKFYVPQVQTLASSSD